MRVSLLLFVAELRPEPSSRPWRELGSHMLLEHIRRFAWEYLLCRTEAEGLTHTIRTLAVP